LKQYYTDSHRYSHRFATLHLITPITPTTPP